MGAAGPARRWHLALGVAIGLAASAAILAAWPDRRGSPPPAEGPVLSDCDGSLEEVVIHYVAEAGETVAPTYRDFLGRLPPGVTVHAVCPDRRDFDDLAARVGPIACTLSPVIVEHAITPWSRDRWLALCPASGGRTVLVCPRDEEGAGVWPARDGDRLVAGDLAAALGPAVAARRSDLYFDGGDFAADDRTVFVRPRVALRNVQQTVATRQELIERLTALWRRRVVLLDDVPDHHVGMYLMSVGSRTVLVGDPLLARRLLAGQPEAEAVDRYVGGADFTPETLARFEAVARQCRAAGYRVIRIPTVCGRDARTYVTYTNAVLDQRDGRRIVYMPAFGCAEVLNRRAAEVWRELGYEVRPIGCDACAKHFGALRCLVNVLRRDAAG